MNDDNRPKDLPPIGGYEDLDYYQRQALSSIQKSMSDYDRGIRDATDSLSKRIVAMELLLDASRFENRERERLLLEQKSTIDILRREIVDNKKHNDTKGYPKI